MTATPQVSTWRTLPLGDVATLQRGYDLPVQNRISGTVPIYAANGTVGKHNVVKVQGPGVVTGRSGTIGRVHFVAGPYWPLNTALYVKDFHGNDPKFVFWLLSQMNLATYHEGSGVPTLNRNNVHAVVVSIPRTIAEQRRIAAILDHADTLRAKRGKAITHLETLTKSIFLEMFGDPFSNPNGSPTSTIGQVALQVTDGEHQTPLRQREGIPLLSARNVRDGFIDIANVDYVGDEEYARISRRCDPSRGDILISCSGSIGRVSQVRDEPPLSLVRSVALVRPNPQLILSTFLEQQLRQDSIRALMVRSANASSQANLFQGQIRPIPVILPALSLQREFGERIKFVTDLRAVQLKHNGQLDALFASLQQRAFSDQL